MSFDTISYILGNKNGYGKGYASGYEDGERDAGEIITIQGSLFATDDGNGLITLTEVTNG